MPTFMVTDPTTGAKLKLTGDSAPTEQELNDIFAKQAPKKTESDVQEEKVRENMKMVPRTIIPGIPGMQPPTFEEAKNMEAIASQGLSGVNRAINTATMNVPENLMNLVGQSGYAKDENPLVKSTGEAVGFIAPGGAPMSIMKAAEIIKNPLTRSIAQGAGAMATQLPTKERGLDEYSTGVGVGGALGVAGRGVEKVAEGAIQAGAKATAGRIHDYLVKLPVGAFKFSKNPVKVAADESIVAGSMAEYEQLAGQRLSERSAQLEAAVQGSDKSVDISSMVNKHFSDARKSLEGSYRPSVAKQKIADLDETMSEIYAKHGDLKNVPVADAIRMKRQLADDFPFVKEGGEDVPTKAAHKIYHDVNEFVNAAHPEIKELNERVSGLIDIKNAARNRSAVEMRNNPVGMVGRLAGIGAAGIGVGAGAPVEGIIAGLGIMGVEKAIQSPAVLTRVAKALSALSGEDRLKIMKAYPELNKVIKVDSRDVEVLPNASRNATVGRPIPKRGEVIDVKGGKVVEGLPFEQRKALPNLPAEKVYKGRGQAIRQGTESGEGVIPLKEQPLPVERGGSSTLKSMEVIEEGETIIPVSKKIEKTAKKATPIPRRGILGNKKGQAILPSGQKKPQDFKTAEEYVASKKSKYRGVHQAPTREYSDIYGALHEIDKTYPSDIYTSPDAWRYYGHGSQADKAMDLNSLGIIRAVKGNPDAEITIYRSVPKGKQTEINPGDWVSINKQYVRGHGERFNEGQTIIEKKVKAGDIFTEGNSIHEFGYDPMVGGLKTDAQLTSEWQAAQGKTIPTKKTTPIKRKGE